MFFVFLAQSTLVYLVRGFMQYEGLKIGINAKNIAQKLELLDAFLKKFMLYVVKISLPPNFRGRIQGKPRFFATCDHW